MRVGYLVLFICVISALFAVSVSGKSEECRLRIITELSSPSTIILDDGSLGGFGVEIVEAIKKEIGCTAKIEVMPWARGYKYAISTPNVLLFSTARTAERESLFNWVGPIVNYKWVFYGLKGRNFRVKSLEDAKSVSGIGVYRGDARAQYLKREGFKNLAVMDSQEANFKKLLHNRVALVASSNIGVQAFLNNDEELKRRVVPVFVFHSVGLYIAISKKTSPEIVSEWQKGFENLKERGVVEEIQKRWGSD